MSLRLAAAYTPHPRMWRSPYRAQHTVQAWRRRANQTVNQKLMAAAEPKDERVTVHARPSTAALRGLVTGLVRHVIGQQGPPVRRRWLISRPQRVEPPIGP